jgi:hypothetical protein
MSDDIVQVDAMDFRKSNSNLLDSLRDEETVMLGEKKSECYWNDTEFPEESLVCFEGKIYECQMGRWLKQDGDC